jgi:hypothetical protein
MEISSKMGLGVGGLGGGHPGKVVYVSDTLTSDVRDLMTRFGIDDFDRTTLMAATITAGLNLVSSNRGDHIMVVPSHAETVTAKIDLNVAGITVKGLGEGRERPTLTGNGLIDVIELSADNIVFDNFHFAAPLTDAQTSHINIDDNGAIVRNITGMGSVGTENVVDMITVTANAHDCLIDGVQFWNDVVAVNSFLSLEGAASRVTVKNFRAFGDVATAGVIDAAKVDYLWLENVIVAVVGTTKPAITLDSNPEGIAINCKWAGTHTTIATNCALGNAMRIFENRVSEETDGSAQGMILPAVDAD